jgi:beta-glucosidase
VTLPRSVGQVPIHAGHRFGGGRSQFWGDYTDGPTSALFTFGHGLSYTTFDYDSLRIRPGSTSDATEIDITITNTGDRAGEEVVQLYVTDEVASVARPRRQLIGFGRVDLQPSQSQTVTFTVHPSRLAFYDSDMRFVCEPGQFTFHVGAAWNDIRRFFTVKLRGDTVEYRQREIQSTTFASARRS